MNITHLDEKQCQALSVKIARILNGAPISQAHHILDETKRLIDYGHTVDVETSRFKGMVNEIEEFEVSSGQSDEQPPR